MSTKTPQPPPIPTLDAAGRLDAGMDDLRGSFIVIEGMDGSGRSTQVALLKEWLEMNGHAVATMGLRRSNLLADNLDDVMAKNTVTRLTLTLLYATDLFDQLDNTIYPALKAGNVVLADRYYYTLIARAAVRGIDRKYLSGIYSAAPEPDLTFFLDVSPQVAFEREFKKSQAISFWEAGRDLNISPDLYESFTVYHKRIRKEFDRLAKTHDFTRLDGEAPIPQVNRMLRKHVAKFLGISSTAYQPSSGLIHLWR